MAESQCLLVIGRDGGLSNLGHSCRFACQKMILKAFPGSGYLRSEDGVNLNVTLLGTLGYI